MTSDANSITNARLRRHVLQWVTALSAIMIIGQFAGVTIVGGVAAAASASPSGPRPGGGPETGTAGAGGLTASGPPARHLK